MDGMLKKIGHEVLEVRGLNKILDMYEYSKEGRKIVAFDDLVNAPDKIQSKIVNHFTDGRHKSISPVYLSQSSHCVPPKTEAKTEL